MNLMAMKRKKRVSVCETQPLTLIGLKQLLSSTDDFELGTVYFSPAEWLLRREESQTHILILDKAFGAKVVLETLAQATNRENGNDDNAPAFLIWGPSMKGPTAMRFLRAGAKGLISKSAPMDTILECLRALGRGLIWIERPAVTGESTHDHQARSGLSLREQEVVQLVIQGCNNRQIGLQLGIEVSTVKVHLKRIFEKAGFRGRYDLVANALHENGPISDHHIKSDPTSVMHPDKL